MEERLSPPAISQSTPRLGLLVWIAGYKFVKAGLALAAALVGRHLVHKDLAATALKWAEFFGANQQSRFARQFVEHVSRLSPNRLHFFIGASFVYMTLYVIEGIGLLGGRRWAEWLVVVQSGILLPWEIYELAHRPDVIRLIVLVLNLVVILYLLWRIRQEDVRTSHSVDGERPSGFGQN